MGDALLKTKFDGFILQNRQAFIDRRVDYLGINIASDLNRELIFKIYYNDKFSRTQSHSLIHFLEKNGMVRYLTMVQDQKEPHGLRFDVGIKSRTNKNMQKVFEWLDKNTQIFKIYCKEVRKLSSMKVTDLENYDYAGLYFLGFVSIDEKISVLKCHYFNRICENPDVLHKNITFADDYYLDFLSNTGIQEYTDLVVVMDKALEYCGGHLWMSGSDYALSGSRKYKIYIKEPNDLYEGLLKAFSANVYETLRKRIINVMNWNQQHEEFYCEGFAVCKDEQAVVSINFYFRIKRKCACE